MNIIKSKGWTKYSCWDNSKIVENLYRKRCKKEVEEMTSHKQAVKLLTNTIKPKETLLDVGCGSGYFYHSIKNQNLNLNYFGIDSSGKLISIGKKYSRKLSNTLLA